MHQRDDFRSADFGAYDHIQPITHPIRFSLPFRILAKFLHLIGIFLYQIRRIDDQKRIFADSQRSFFFNRCRNSRGKPRKIQVAGKTIKNLL